MQRDSERDDGLSSLSDRGTCFVMRERAQKPPNAVVLARAYCVLCLPTRPFSRIYYNATVSVWTMYPRLPYPPTLPAGPIAHVLLTNQQYSKVTLTRPAPYSTHAKPIARIHLAVGTPFSNTSTQASSLLPLFPCLSSDPLLRCFLRFLSLIVHTYTPHRSPRKS
jgi:hypothetical protein